MLLPSSPPRLPFEFGAEVLQTLLVALALSNHATLSQSSLVARIAAVTLGSITEQFALRQVRIMEAAGDESAAPPVALTQAEVLILKMVVNDTPWDVLPTEAQMPLDRIIRATLAVEQALTAEWPQQERLQHELKSLLRRPEGSGRVQ